MTHHQTKLTPKPAPRPGFVVKPIIDGQTWGWHERKPDQGTQPWLPGRRYPVSHLLRPLMVVYAPGRQVTTSTPLVPGRCRTPRMEANT